VLRNRRTANLYKKLQIRTLQLEKSNSYLSSSMFLSNMCNVLFSYACILIGQGFICRYIFMAMYSFVPPFREATFCGVPSCVWQIRVSCGRKKVAEHWSEVICIDLSHFHRAWFLYYRSEFPGFLVWKVSGFLFQFRYTSLSLSRWRYWKPFSSNYVYRMKRCDWFNLLF
jgi:hypothetical protein